MPKPGLEYQQLVAEIEAAFDPGAVVQVGEWIEGPDGQRDCDVSVRGTRNGVPRFVFIECKDYTKKRVGIETIDKLESVRRDLRPDAAYIYSNSGYSAPALQKAARVGINCVVAVATGDGRSRAKLGTLVYGQLLELGSILESFIEPAGQDLAVPDDVTPFDFRFDGGLIHNWIATSIDQLVGTHRKELEVGNHVVTVTYSFSEPLTFNLRESTFLALGLQVVVNVDAKWMAKTIQMGVDLGRFDEISGVVHLPPNTNMDFYGLDDRDWEAVSAPLERQPPEGDFVHVTLYGVLQSPAMLADGPTADLGPHIASTDIVITPRVAQ